MVVLRSTTPCVAVNSRSNSTLLTVISIVPTAVPAAMTASTGIDFALPCRLLLLLLPYIKCKTYKTSSNSRWVGEVENFGKRPIVTTLEIAPLCEKSLPNLPETSQQDFRFCHTPDSC